MSLSIDLYDEHACPVICIGPVFDGYSEEKHWLNNKHSWFMDIWDRKSECMGWLALFHPSPTWYTLACNPNTVLLSGIASACGTIWAWQNLRILQTIPKLLVFVRNSTMSECGCTFSGSLSLDKKTLYTVCTFTSQLGVGSSFPVSKWVQYGAVSTWCGLNNKSWSLKHGSRPLHLHKCWRKWTFGAQNGFWDVHTPSFWT